MGLDTVQICYDDGVNGESCNSAVSLVQASGAWQGAKSFGEASPPVNYYQMDNTTPDPDTYKALIDATSTSDTYDELTLVFCLKPITFGFDMIFSGADDSFVVYMPSNQGGLAVTLRTSDGWGQSVYVNYSDSPAPDIVEGQWSSIMVTFKGLATSPETSLVEVVINGTKVNSTDWESGASGSQDKRPMAYGGNSYVGNGNPLGYGTLECDLAYVWATDQYLDPDTYWSSFFDGSNVPQDIGADGSSVTGTAPKSYFPDADFTNNRGSGSNWEEVGTVPDAATTPWD